MLESLVSKVDLGKVRNSFCMLSGTLLHVASWIFASFPTSAHHTEEDEKNAIEKWRDALDEYYMEDLTEKDSIKWLEAGYCLTEVLTHCVLYKELGGLHATES